MRSAAPSASRGLDRLRIRLADIIWKPGRGSPKRGWWPCATWTRSGSSEPAAKVDRTPRLYTDAASHVRDRRDARLRRDLHPARIAPRARRAGGAVPGRHPLPEAGGRRAARAQGDDRGLRSTGIRLMIHENWRFRPWYRALRAEIDAGTIGRPIRLRISPPRHAGAAARRLRRPALPPHDAPADPAGDGLPPGRHRAVPDRRDPDRLRHASAGSAATASARTWRRSRSTSPAAAWACST